MTLSAGNMLYVTAGDGSSLTTATGITATGHTFTTIQNFVGTSPTLHTWYELNVAGGATTFTCTMNQTQGTNAAFMIEEWSGIATTAALDQSATATNTTVTTTPTTGTTATTTQADELIICSIAINTGTTTVAAGSGYGAGAGGSFASFLGAGTAGAFVAVQSKIVAATGTQVGSFTLGAARDAPAAINTFKLAAAGGPITQPVMGGMTSAVARSSTW